MIQTLAHHPSNVVALSPFQGFRRLTKRRALLTGQRARKQPVAAGTCF